MNTVYIYNHEYDGLCISNDEPYLEDNTYCSSSSLSACEELLGPFGITVDKVPGSGEGFLKINLSITKIEEAIRNDNLIYTDITPTKSKKSKKK